MKWDSLWKCTPEMPRVYPYYLEGSGAGGFVHWSYALLPYYKLAWDNPAYHCPAYNGVITITSWGDYQFGSYAYNEMGSEGAGESSTNNGSLGLGVGYGGGAAPVPPPQPETAVVAPSQMFAMMDSPLTGNQSQMSEIAAGNTNHFLMPWGRALPGVPLLHPGFIRLFSMGKRSSTGKRSLCNMAKYSTQSIATPTSRRSRFFSCLFRRPIQSKWRVIGTWITSRIRKPGPGNGY